MHKLIIEDKATRYTRISKPRARKLFSKGKPFDICPHKLRPGYPWAPNMHVDSARYLAEGWTFDDMVANFVFHNCECRETGYYPAFYLTEAIDKTK